MHRTALVALCVIMVLQGCGEDPGLDASRDSSSELSSSSAMDPVLSSSIASWLNSSSSFAMKAETSAPWTGASKTVAQDKETNCYLIGTGEEFAWVTHLTPGQSIPCIRLVANIILNEATLAVDANGVLLPTVTALQPWVPSRSYINTLDGNGYVISGLYVDQPTSDTIGLFSAASIASIQVKNLGVVNAYVHGRKMVGGIFGNNGPDKSINSGSGVQILNSYFRGTVVGDTIVGGLAGLNSGSIEGSRNEGSIFANKVAGGIAGICRGNLTNTSNQGSINNGSVMGGICGSLVSQGVLSRVQNTGEVKGQYTLGGIVGMILDSATIKQGVNGASITGNNDIGGIVGFGDWYRSMDRLFIDQTLDSLHNEGSILGIENVGGIAGNITRTIMNSSNVASVTGNGSIGGIIGYESGNYNYSSHNVHLENDGLIKGNYSVGGIVGSGGWCSLFETDVNRGEVHGIKYVGGIAGGTVADLRNVQNHGLVVGDTSVGGIAGYSDFIFQATNTQQVKGLYEVGGIVGKNNYHIDTLTNLGNVIGGYRTGGIAGHSKSSITFADNQGDVSGTSNVAGIVGFGRSVYDSHNSGSVTATGDSVGGIAGFGAVLAEVNNSGVVSGARFVGGIAGQVSLYVDSLNSNNNQDGHVFNVYNTGKVNGKGSWIGGLVGLSTDSIYYGYNVGQVSNSDQLGLSGTLVGELQSGLSNVYSNSSRSLPACGLIPVGNANSISVCANALQTNAFMKSQALADLLNANNPIPVWAWSSVVNNSYPYLIE